LHDGLGQNLLVIKNHAQLQALIVTDEQSPDAIHRVQRRRLTNARRGAHYLLRPAPAASRPTRFAHGPRGDD
jgi:hypothetical protein